MNNSEIIKIIKDLQKLNIPKSIFSKFLKNNYKNIYDEILLKTKFLDKFHNQNDKNKWISIYERIYCIENNLSDRPKCKMCGSEYVCGFNKQTNEYKKWCCPSCQASDIECITKSKEKRNELYGNPNYNGIEKSRRTRYKNNGGKWHDNDFLKKTKETKFKRYGSDTWINIEKRNDTISKIKKLNPKYYDEIHNKIKETNVRNGHDETWNNREKFKNTISEFSKERKAEINEKRKATNEKQNGYSFYMQSKEGKTHIAEENMRRYGVKSALQLKESRLNKIINQKLSAYKNIKTFKKYTPLFTEDEYITSNENQKKFKWKFKCNTCGCEFMSVYSNGIIHSRCPNCEPQKYRLSQTEVFDFVKSLNKKQFSDIEQDVYDVVSGKYLDVCSKNGKFAVEYDGLSWHTYEENALGDKKPHDYHLKKTDCCESKGYTLIHITEDEWLDNKKLCKGLLRRILNCKRYSLNSSDCTIVELSEDDKNMFMKKYSFSHNGDNSSVKIGLKYRNRLVSLLTFINISKGEWKLSNYSTLNNFEINEDFQKMMNYFESTHKPKSVICPVDRRWFNKNTHYCRDFEFIKNTKPNYWYVKNQHRFNPMIFTYSYIKESLAFFSKEKSIIENMNENGYKRYFDCGNMVFIKEY